MSIQPIQPAPDAGALALPTVTGGNAGGLAVLQDWLTAADAASTLARSLVQSFFVPQAYKVNVPARASREEAEAALEIAVANATGAILLGQSLGLDPLTSLQQIYVVHGRPGMYAKLKVALAQARGHRVWDEEYSPEAVTVAGQRRGTDDVVRIRITIEDARRAKWTEQNANYGKTPADMLWARAASRVVDRVAADVLFGLASIEDLEDDEPAPAAAARVTIEDVRGPVAEKVSPAALAAAAPAAPAPAEPEPPTLVDEPTWNAINAAFVRLGVTGPGVRQRRETAIRRIIDRPETPAEAGTSPRTWLTQHDATLVVGTLQGTDRDGIAALLGEAPTTTRETTAAPAHGEQVGTFQPPQPDDVDLGDADPDGDDDFVPEPDDDERAAAEASTAGVEPKGW